MANERIRALASNWSRVALAGLFTALPTMSVPVVTAGPLSSDAGRRTPLHDSPVSAGWGEDHYGAYKYYGIWGNGGVGSTVADATPVSVGGIHSYYAPVAAYSAAAVAPVKKVLVPTLARTR